MTQTETIAGMKKKSKFAKLAQSMSPFEGNKKQEKVDDQAKDKRRMAPVVETVEQEESFLSEDEEKSELSNKDLISEEIEEMDELTEEHGNLMLIAMRTELFQPRNCKQPQRLPRPKFCC